MTKSELEQIFDKFARTAIKEDDGEWYLYGHNVNVAPMGAYWDVYLCNQKEISQGDMTAYLGTGKLNNLYATVPESIPIHKINGEGWFQTGDLELLKSWLLENRKALGIKKRVKRTMTEAQMSNIGRKSTVAAPV